MLRSSPRPGFLLLLLAVLGLVFQPAAANAQLNAQEQAIADRMISHGSQGRPFLRVDPILVQVARARAADMARRNYFSHVNPDGHGPNYLVERAGYPLPDWWGNDPEANYIESIAAGRSSAPSTWDDWMNSPSHREHLLATDSFSRDQTSYGIGYAYDAGSTYKHYWVVITAPPRPTPSLTVAAPVANARVTVPQIAVAGTTAGSVPVQAVQFRVENTSGTGPFQNAVGTSGWSGVATGLAPGPNTIRFRSLGATGNVLAETTRAVSYVLLRPLTVAVSGEGTVTAGFAGTTDREVGRRYSLTATPASGWLFTGWPGSVTSSARSLDFTMREGLTLSATFIPNPFFPLRGGFRGLVQGAQSGLLTLSLTSTGTFTGRLTLSGKAYALKGRFGLDGAATVSVPRRGLEPLTVALQLDFAGGTGLAATVSDGVASSSLVAAANYRAAEGRFAKAGRYTVSLPANAEAADLDAPKGDGYATLTIDAKGATRLAGVLADGRSFSTTGVISGGETVAFYAPLYASLGCVTGRFALRESAVTDLDGTFRWSKPELLTARIPTRAFDTDGVMAGSRYVAPARGTPVLTVAAGEANSELTVGTGQPGETMVQPTTLEPSNRIHVTEPVLPGLRVRIQAASGIYSGSFTHPATGAATRLRGVIFQKQNAGYGFFVGADGNGYTTLTPAE